MVIVLVINAILNDPNVIEMVAVAIITEKLYIYICVYITII